MRTNTPISTQTRYHGSLFAGIGGLCTAFNQLGYYNAFANEIENAVAETYKKNHPTDNFISGSIEKIHSSDLPSVDVMHGGFPCQSFSIAGARGGFNDGRGTLFFQISRLLKEYGENKPKVLLLENSPNLLIGDGGAWIRKIIHELNKSGYWFDLSNAIILDVAKHTGIPQSRERLFIVALNSDYYDGNFIHQDDFSEVPLSPMSNFIYPFSDVSPEYYLPIGNKYESLILEHRVDDPYQIYQLRKFYVRLAPSGLCPTLTANMGLGGHNVPFIITNGRVRKLTERECLNLQGFGPDFTFPNGISAGRKYQMIGNAVSPQIAAILAKKITTILESQ